MFSPIFTITPHINSQIAEIERLKTLFEHSTILPELEVELRFRATVETVHSSTSIEGNPLSELQVQNILQGTPVTASSYAIKEVLNYKNAIDWMSQHKNHTQFLNSNEILNLHRMTMKGLLPDEKVGHWRPGEIFVVDEKDGKEIVQYQGPSAEETPELVEQLLQWIKDQKQHGQLHPVLFAGLIHYMFVSIHPFSDGNGRTTRLITHFYLKTAEYDFKDSLSLDSYYLQHRMSYYQALSGGKTFEERINADITPFLEFFVEGFLRSTQTISRYIQEGMISNDGEKPLRLSQDELTILDYVYQFGSITIHEAIDITSTSKRTTQRRLTELTEKEILSIKGKGPATTYILASKV